MPAAKPYYTSNDLIESVKRKITFPTSQSTFSDYDILAFANEEMFIAQVPSVLQYHEEYFVFRYEISLSSNVDRYPIPDRSIGMKLRDLFWSDAEGNLYEMTRIDSEDKAFFQRAISMNEVTAKFYLEGNDVILTPAVSDSPTGKLVFFLYLRPNQLVKDERAATCNFFVQQVQMNVATLADGDTITINNVVLTARTGSPSTNEFQIGGDSIITATNLVNLVNGLGLASATNGSPSTSIIYFKFINQLYTFLTSNSSAFIIAETQGVEFISLPSTYLNTSTQKTEPLFVEGSLVDFLQTKPGHKTRAYDVVIPTGSIINATGINGTIVFFNEGTVPSEFIIGDYICLANEAIIPQIPPDLHNLLAERTAARILAALGDQAGLQASNQKIQEMELRQGNLLDNRIDGSIKKLNGRKSILRFQSINSRRRV